MRDTDTQQERHTATLASEVHHFTVESDKALCSPSHRPQSNSSFNQGKQGATCSEQGLDGVLLLAHQILGGHTSGPLHHVG